MSDWTFGRKILSVSVVTALVIMLLGGVSLLTSRQLFSTGRWVFHTYAVLTQLEVVMSTLKDAETAQRGFIITGDPTYLGPYQSTREALPTALTELGKLIDDNASQKVRLDRMRPLIDEKLAFIERTVDERRTHGFATAQRLIATNQGKAMMDRIRAVVAEMREAETVLLEERRAQADGAVLLSEAVTSVGTLVGLLAVIGAGVWLTHSLRQQVGTAVTGIHGSTAALETAAQQQATSSTEQASAITEIASTMRELTATSRQISESAVRVSRAADDTDRAAEAGERTVRQSQEAVASIQHQVDQIVTSTGDLGRKTQQIGLIVEIINELSEQTNILAINATIESAGAGEAGRRFAAVAEEIRKLANRVGGSTREIRLLVEDIRTATRASLTATEEGARAVATGAAQVGEVAHAFRRINELVGGTAEAAREIELSTRQQSTAVEQVHLAVSDLAQAAKETESATRETLATSTRLAGLSRDLSRIVTRGDGG